MLEIKNMPARLDIQHWKGDTFDRTIELYNVSGGVETPFDFTDYAGEFIIERVGSDTPELTTGTATGEMTFPNDGEIRIEIADDVLTDALDTGKYDLRIKLISPAGVKRTYFAGEFKFEYK